MPLGALLLGNGEAEGERGSSDSQPVLTQCLGNHMCSGKQERLTRKLSLYGTLGY